MPTIQKVLVVAPANLKINWLRELRKWLVRPLRPFIAQGNLGFPDFADIVIINFDILTRFPRELTRADYWDLVVVDEAHFIKGKSQRAEAVKAIPARRRLCLTGTPIPNRAKELFNVVNWLQPEVFSNFYKFLYKYCGGAKEGVERLVVLQTKLRSTCMVRRLKRDVLSDLPAIQRQIIEIASDDPCLGAERDLVSGHEEELERLQAALELAKVSDNEADYHAALKALQDGCKMSMGEMAKARHNTALAKLPYLISHLEDCMEGGNKIVFFGHHRDVIEAVYNHFGDRAVIHYGGMGQAEAQASVDNFQNDPAILLFAGSIKASGVGITLTASSHEVFGELDWTPGGMSQCEGRCHRLGQRESVLVQHLVLEGSIDATMAKALVEKQQVADIALDRDRETLMVEPIIPTVRNANVRSIVVKRSEIEEKSLLLKQDTIVAIHQCLKTLANVCDGARARDGAGFNGVDTIIGKSLATARFLTPRQAVLGAKLLRKYKKQLPEDSYVTALQKAGEE